MKKGQKAPRRRSGGLRARAWWVLRKNRAMTLLEIQATLCDGTEKNSATNLRVYLKKLVEVGILDRTRIDDGKPTSNGSHLYTVINNIGPCAPVARSGSALVYDPNSGETLDVCVSQAVKP
jgi:hypothetical protein